MYYRRSIIFNSGSFGRQDAILLNAVGTAAFLSLLPQSGHFVGERGQLDPFDVKRRQSARSISAIFSAFCLAIRVGQTHRADEQALRNRCRWISHGVKAPVRGSQDLYDTPTRAKSQTGPELS